MKQIRTIVFFPIFNIIILSGCTSDADIIPPKIEMLDFSSVITTGDVCGSSSNDLITLHGGQTMTFRLLLSDDVELSQYKIDIHNNFDCHGHGGAIPPSIKPPIKNGQTSEWNVLRVVPVKGTFAEENISLTIPENNTAGLYHFSIQCIDAAGNESPNNKIFSVKLFNPEDTIAPTIELQTPEKNLINVKKGEKITFSGKLSDNRPLGIGGNGMVFISYINSNSGNSFATNSYSLMGSEASKTESFNLEFTIPQTFSSGKYIFYVGALDGVRNQSDAQRFEILVL